MKYSLSDVRKITGFSERTLRSMIRNGHLTGEKVSGIWRFSAGDIDAFFKLEIVKSSMQSKIRKKYISFITGEEMKSHPESRLFIIGSFADYENFSLLGGMDVILSSLDECDFEYFRFMNDNRPLSVFSGNAADLMNVLSKLADYYKSKT